MEGVGNPLVRAAVGRAIGRCLAAVGDWLAPPACAACDAPIAAGVAFCVPCAGTVDRLDPGRPLAAFAFGGAVRDAVVRFKYGGRSDLARPLGSLLLGAAGVAGLSADLVVPVPLHPVRLAERGFNQAALLARVLAPSCGSFTPSLRRVAVRQRQASLGRAERLANLDGAFVAHPRVRGRSVIVVDDVWTTGATFAACEAALLGAGAAAVTPFALARTLRSAADRTVR